MTLADLLAAGVTQLGLAAGDLVAAGGPGPTGTASCVSDVGAFAW